MSDDQVLLSSLTVAATNVRQSVHTAMGWLRRLPGAETEREKHLWLWECVLTSLAWDISEAAISLSAFGSVRAARALNRLLLEYAARVHHYLYSPERAEADGALAENALRRAMKPTASAAAQDDRLKDLAAFVSSGSNDVSYPKVHEMLKAMLRNCELTSSDVRRYGRWLEAEYFLGSGIIHGSQIVLFDVVTGEGGGLDFNDRSTTFSRLDEMLRTVTNLLMLLSALQRRHRRDFGAAVHVEALNALGSSRQRTTMARHNALCSILGIRV